MIQHDYAGRPTLSRILHHNGMGEPENDIMTKATKFRDRPHARVYADWRDLPAWRTLTLVARAVLVEVMLDYRPGMNGRLEWSCRKAAAAVGVSKATAARALTELELKGWLRVERVAGFARRTSPSLYSLTMFKDDLNHDPPSRAFEIWTPNTAMPKPIRVSPEGHEGLTRGTRQSCPRDTAADSGGPVHVSDALKSSLAFKRFSKID